MAHSLLDKQGNVDYCNNIYFVVALAHFNTIFLLYTPPPPSHFVLPSYTSEQRDRDRDREVNVLMNDLCDIVRKHCIMYASGA